MDNNYQQTPVQHQLPQPQTPHEEKKRKRGRPPKNNKEQAQHASAVEGSEAPAIINSAASTAIEPSSEQHKTVASPADAPDHKDAPPPSKKLKSQQDNNNNNNNNIISRGGKSSIVAEPIGGLATPGAVATTSESSLLEQAHPSHPSSPLPAPATPHKSVTFNVASRNNSTPSKKNKKKSGGSSSSHATQQYTAASSSNININSLHSRSATVAAELAADDYYEELLQQPTVSHNKSQRIRKRKTPKKGSREARLIEMEISSFNTHHFPKDVADCLEAIYKKLNLASLQLLATKTSQFPSGENDDDEEALKRELVTLLVQRAIRLGYWQFFKIILPNAELVAESLIEIKSSELYTAATAAVEAAVAAAKAIESQKQAVDSSSDKSALANETSTQDQQQKIQGEHTEETKTSSAQEDKPVTNPSESQQTASLLQPQPDTSTNVTNTTSSSEGTSVAHEAGKEETAPKELESSTFNSNNNAETAKPIQAETSTAATQIEGQEKSHSDACDATPAEAGSSNTAATSSGEAQAKDSLPVDPFIMDDQILEDDEHMRKLFKAALSALGPEVFFHLCTKSTLARFTTALQFVELNASHEQMVDALVEEFLLLGAKEIFNKCLKEEVYDMLIQFPVLSEISSHNPKHHLVSHILSTEFSHLLDGIALLDNNGVPSGAASTSAPAVEEDDMDE